MNDPEPARAFTDADASYAAIVAALERTREDGRAMEFLSRLVLLLAADVGDHRRIAALVARAAQGTEPS